MRDLPLDEVLHGDCIETMNALPDKCVDLIFADPPYNMQLQRDLWRPNMTKVDAVTDEWDKFASLADYDRFTREWLTACRRVLKDSGTLWVIGSYHNIYRVGAILMDLDYWILNDVVWVKANPLPQMKGVRLCNAHETLLWVKKSKEQTGYTFHYREMKAGNEEKQLRSDWYFPICSGGERETVNGSKAHTTQKPEALLHRVLAATTNPGDVVLDPFCGTGTTAAVAKRLGRRFITVDRDAEYVAIARARLARICAVPPPADAPLIPARKPRVAFAHLVEAGRVEVGTTLWLKASGVTAVVQEDGTLAANGVRGSIHKMASHCTGIPHSNGWTHWFYCEADTGELRPLDDLRRRDDEP